MEDAGRRSVETRLPARARWLAVAVVAGGILYASVLDSPSSGLPALGPLGVFRIDKWLHALAYAALAGALAGALAPGRSPARTAALAVLLAVAYGVGLEFVQAPIPERHFSIADMVADGAGAFAAVLGWRLGVRFLGWSRRNRGSESDV